MNPFVAAKSAWLMAEDGPARVLPVELAMADDLPVFLIQPPRVQIPYGSPGDGRLLLYFLDRHAWLPEPDGLWVEGSARADIIVSSTRPIDHLAVEAESPITTRLTIAMGAQPLSVMLEVGATTRFDLPAAGIRGRRLALEDFVYLLTASSTNGFTPHLFYPGSGDYRYLGARLRFKAIPTAGVGASDDK
jgi:hypothetical protein